MSWKLKLNDSGNPVINDSGNLILTDEEGSEREHNAVDSQLHLNRLRKEAQVKKDRIKELEQENSGYKRDFELYSDILKDPEATRAAIETVSALGDDVRDRESELVELKTRHKQEINTIKETYEGESGKLTVLSAKVTDLERKLVQQRYIPAWIGCDEWRDWRITPTESGFMSEFGRFIQDDGTCVGHDGTTVTGYDVGEDHAEPAKDPVKVLRYLLETHPEKEKLMLSKIPPGSGVGDGAARNSFEKFFDPKSPDYNKSDQMKVYRESPEEYAKMKKRYKV